MNKNNQEILLFFIKSETIIKSIAIIAIGIIVYVIMLVMDQWLKDCRKERNNTSLFNETMHEINLSV